MSLSVKHYLEVYKHRLEMQRKGITNPSKEIKDLTKIIVEKLSELPPDETIKLKNEEMIDSQGNIIVKFPSNN